MIEDIKKLSDIVGINHLYIRYDLIFFSKHYDLNYHIKAFNHMCSLLNGYVETIIISFIDDYKNVRNHKDNLKIRTFTDNDYVQIGINFSKIVKKMA